MWYEHDLLDGTLIEDNDECESFVKDGSQDSLSELVSVVVLAIDSEYQGRHFLKPLEVT
jgi:hypothetical protein